MGVVGFLVFMSVVTCTVTAEGGIFRVEEGDIIRQRCPVDFKAYNSCSIQWFHNDRKVDSKHRTQGRRNYLNKKNYVKLSYIERNDGGQWAVRPDISCSNCVEVWCNFTLHVLDDNGNPFNLPSDQENNAISPAPQVDKDSENARCGAFALKPSYFMLLYIIGNTVANMLLYLKK